jgi:SPP1 gp7 family putative phage head morphogenesis protein
MPTAKQQYNRRRNTFGRARRTESEFAAKLRKIAKHIADIVRGFPIGLPDSLPLVERALSDYSRLIEPWARAVATAMLEDVSRRDAKAWAEYTAGMSVALRREIERAPTGATLRQLLGEQVFLIKSIPIEAAQRVHELTLEGQISGARFGEIVPEIMRTEEVTRSRATLIARTETARTASALTQARAEHIGSTHYQWLTAGDSDVRPSHRALNGKVFAWSSPPICDPPDHRAHPGQIWNCRCVPLPIIPEHIQ